MTLDIERVHQCVIVIRQVTDAAFVVTSVVSGVDQRHVLSEIGHAELELFVASLIHEASHTIDDHFLALTSQSTSHIDHVGLLYAHVETSLRKSCAETFEAPHVCMHEIQIRVVVFAQEYV